MNAVEELLARADAIADGFMATSLAAIGEEAEQLEDYYISALRETYKAAWLSGYRVGMEEVTVDAGA